MKKIPVTVVCGFLGSGKTTVLNHILETKRAQRVALIVNDMAEVNVDARQVGDKVSETEEKLVQIQNGCICCTLREDLFNETKKIAEEDAYDYLVIEASGIAEPLPIAATFTFEMEDGKSLRDVAELDTMVTVVDAHNFLAEYHTEDTLKDRKQEVSEDDERSVVDLMIDQLEFANVVLVNKTELVSNAERRRIHQMIRALNAEAQIIDTTRGNVPLEAIMGTKRFDFEKAQQYPTWLLEMQRDSGHLPETEGYGISSFVYRARRPFVPARIMELLTTPIEGLVRAKGLFWLCTRMDDVGDFQLAGSLIDCSPIGKWWASVDEEDWPERARDSIYAEWEEPFGDRRQEIVFIGIDLSRQALESRLDACLITEEELQQDYTAMSDPFSEWIGADRAVDGLATGQDDLLSSLDTTSVSATTAI
jgi:G3E family GTPase